MKTILLKRLRREAKKVYRIEYHKPYYRVAERGYTGSKMYYDGKDYVYSDRDSIQEAVSLIIKLRRKWILDKLIKFKIIRINKQLRKL
jgi:hypothetical protein